MDNSKKYILMCESNSEIQELWVPSCGDYIISDTYGYLKICSANILEKTIHKIICGVWLPHVDQLQEIMLKEEKRVWRLHERFDNWIPIGAKPESFEQLWLAFVMDQEFKKTWDGEKWNYSTI